MQSGRKQRGGATPSPQPPPQVVDTPTWQKRPVFRQLQTAYSQPIISDKRAAEQRHGDLKMAWREHRDREEEKKRQSVAERRKREVLKRMLGREALMNGLEDTVFELMGPHPDGAGVVSAKQRRKTQDGQEVRKEEQKRKVTYLPLRRTIFDHDIVTSDGEPPQSLPLSAREGGFERAGSGANRGFLSARASSAVKGAFDEVQSSSLDSARDHLRPASGRSITAREMKSLLSSLFLPPYASEQSGKKRAKAPSPSRPKPKPPLVPRLSEALLGGGSSGDSNGSDSARGATSTPRREEKGEKEMVGDGEVSAELMAKHPSLRNESRRVLNAMEKLNAHVLIEVNPLLEPPVTAAAMRRTMSIRSEHFFDSAFHSAVEGGIDAAVQDFKHALEHFPDHPICMYNLATLLIFQCDYAGAIRLFSRLVRLLEVSGLVKEQQREEEEEGSTMQRLSPRSGQRTDGSRRGVLVEGMSTSAKRGGKASKRTSRKKANALEALKSIDVHALRENLHFPLNVYYSRIFNNRGLCYHHLYQYKEAIRDFTQSLHHDDNNVLALRNRGMSYRQARNYTSSIADYLLANTMEPDYESWVKHARERRQALTAEKLVELKEREDHSDALVLDVDEMNTTAASSPRLSRKSPEGESESPTANIRMVRTSSHLSPLVVGDDSTSRKLAKLEMEEEAEELREREEEEEISSQMHSNLGKIGKKVSLNTAVAVASSVVKFKALLKGKKKQDGDSESKNGKGGEGGGEGGKSGRQVSFLAVSKPGEEEKDDAEEVREKKTNDLPAGLLVQNVPEPTPGERSRKLIRRLSMRVTESPLLRRGSSSGASTPEMGSPRDGSPSRRTQDSASPRKSMLQRFHLHAGDDDNDNDSERVKREELRAHFEKVEAERRERERIAKEAEEKRVEDIKDSYRQAENADILLKSRLEEIEKSDLLPHEKEEAAAEQIDCRAIVDPEVQAPLLFTNIEEGIGSHNYSRILDRHFELALMKSPLLRSERDIKVINRWLSNSDFLSHHSLPVRQEICSRMRVVRSRGGDFLFHAGDKANDFYYILSGAVTVERASTTSDAVVVLKTLVKGNAFGFASLYSNNYCPNDEELEKIVAMQNPKNKGKGDAMKEGFARVRTVSKVKLLTKKLLAVARAPRRNATVRIYEDSVLLAVSHDDYVASLAKYDLSQVYRQDIYAKLRALRGFTIFLSWGHDELVKLASSIRIHHLKMDRIALDVGEKPKSLYFVKSGTCYMLYPRQVAGADGGERPLSPFSKRRKSSMLGRPGTAGGGTSERKRSESMRGGRGKGEEETKEDRARVLARFHQPSKELFQAINQNKAFQTLKKEAQKTEAADKEEKPLLPPGADTPVPSPTPSGRASKMSGRTSGMSTTSTSLPTPEALLEEEGYRKDDDDGSNFEEIMTLQAGSVFGVDPYFYHLSQSSQTKGATREVGLVEDSDEEGGREGEKRRRKKKGGGGGGGGIGTMSKREKEERADAILLEKAESSMQKPSPVRIKTDTHVELLELPLAELWRLGEKTSVEVHERHPLVVMDLRRHLGQRAQWDKQKREIVTSCLRPHSKTVLAKKRENGEKGI